jgi:hypothetical protein
VIRARKFASRQLLVPSFLSSSTTPIDKLLQKELFPVHFFTII